MKDKIGQLDTMLKELLATIELQLLSETMTRDFENDLDEEVNEKYRERLVVRSSPENIKLFNEQLLSLKSLLSETLDKVNRVPTKRNKGFEYFTMPDLHPNEEFKSLVAKHILSVDQPIWGKFRRKTFCGYLTKDGYFKLEFYGKTILCQDLKYPIFLAWGKDVPNDGWSFWNAFDNETGEPQVLNYFRQQLRQHN